MASRNLQNSNLAWSSTGKRNLYHQLKTIKVSGFDPEPATEEPATEEG